MNTDYVHEHFAKHPGWKRPAIVCRDGYMVSVQASEFHYCSPKATDAERYHSVEVWATARNDRPVTIDPEGWVSVEKVNARIARHGGVEE